MSSQTGFVVEAGRDEQVEVLSALIQHAKGLDIDSMEAYEADLKKVYGEDVVADAWDLANDRYRPSMEEYYGE